MTTTIRLPQSLIETVDGIVSSDFRYSSRSHLIECVLQGFVADYELGDDEDADEDEFVVIGGDLEDDDLEDDDLEDDDLEDDDDRDD
jgi:metal-responsive CopG/Arc/MetJ family transcriptional regulator